MLSLVHGALQVVVGIMLGVILAVGLIWGFNQEAEVNRQTTEAWLEG